MIINTSAGPLRGRLSSNASLLHLRGVPFAAPPLGEHANQASRPPTPWREPLDATEAGPAPLQPQLFGMGMRSASQISQDCLTLNVDAPVPDPNQRRPIMVWIFGGGYITGDAADELFDGSNFARRGVILVRANYRLGALGRNNLLLQDQLLALEWVKENAKNLGGDPDRITLFGESAGAMSICNLLTMPRAKGLFQAAIAQSGAGANVATTQQAQIADQRWQEERKLLSDPESPKELMDLQTRLGRELRPKFGGMPFRPVVDGDLLPAPPEETAGLGAEVPLLIGHNADEHRLYMNPRYRMKPGGLLEELSERLPADVISELPRCYPGLTDVERLAATLTELLYRAPQERYVRARETTRVRQGLPSNTWTYRFNWPSPALRGWLSACHAIEIPFVFNNFSQRSTAKFVGPGAGPLADQVQALWCEFAHTHAPPKLWQPYPDVLEIHPGLGCREVSEIETFWNSALLS